MNISRNSLAFMSMLAAGVLLAGAAVLLPSAQTFGSETDEAAAAERARSIEDGLQRQSAVPAPNYPGVASGTGDRTAGAPAPVPPAAPIDPPAPAGSVETPAGLPSAGSGGYLNADGNLGLAYALMALAVSLFGSGSLVWAYSSRR